MEVLVIADVHLKPEIIEKAILLRKRGIGDQTVCLMDLADDWAKGTNLSLYEKTYDEAIRFAKMFPDTKFCWGNHDISYLWNRQQSGFSTEAAPVVRRKLLELQQALPNNNPIRFVQKIDNVLFSHGGVHACFVEEYVPANLHNDVERVVKELNKLGEEEMWKDFSPIWLRPKENVRLYKQRDCLQIVGHTPQKEIVRKGNLISCDVFSTYRNGEPIGSEELLLVNTKTWQYRGIK